jgi:hypothetical protein
MLQMTTPPRSILAFGVFLLIGASGLMIAPRLVLPVIGLADPGILWPRLLALPMIVIAFFYIQAAREGAIAFFRWTIPARSAGALFLVTLAAFRIGPPFLAILAAIDLAAVYWTRIELTAASKG